MKRTISRWLALVYTLTNVFCVYAGETNYWEERRQAVQRRSSPTRLASFNVPRSAELVATGPSASLQTQLPGQLMPASHRALLPGMEKDWGWLPELVANYGDIREIHVASRPDAPVVIHLQDVHDLEEAQKNLAGLVESLRAKRGISLVGLEGALGSFELDFFREGPLDVRKKLSDRFLNLGYLTGPEVAGIIAEKPPTLWGIEDVELYRGHVEAFEQSESGRAQVRQFLTALTVEADKARETFYSPALRALDDHRRAYMSHQKSLGDYVPALWSAQKGVKKAYPQVALLVKLLAQEQTLDFKEVERQRVRLAEVLAQRLSPEELDRLVKASMAYRSGRQTAGAYQKYLANVCRHNNIRLDTFGPLASYMDYVQVADPLDSGKLLDELDRLELAALTGTAETNEEKKLVDVFRGLALVDKLTNHGLTPQEWRVLKKDDLSLEHIRSVLTQISPTSVSKTVSLPDLSPYKEFCLKAEQRNNALVKNLLAKIKTDKVNSAVLVAGGFHTEGMTALLKEANASYVVITPKISKVPDTRPLDIFVRAPLPLEKLLAGDVIHLAYPRLTQQSSDAMAAANNAIERKETLYQAWKSGLAGGSAINGNKRGFAFFQQLNQRVRSALAVSRLKSLMKELPFFMPPVLGVLVAEFLTSGLGPMGGLAFHVFGGVTAAILFWPTFLRHHARAEAQWTRDNPGKTPSDYRRKLLLAYGLIGLATIGAMIFSPEIGDWLAQIQGASVVSGEMGRVLQAIVFGGLIFHGFFNFLGRLAGGPAFVPAMAEITEADEFDPDAFLRKYREEMAQGTTKSLPNTHLDFTVAGYRFPAPFGWEISQNFEKEDVRSHAGESPRPLEEVVNHSADRALDQDKRRWLMGRFVALGKLLEANKKVLGSLQARNREQAEEVLDLVRKMGSAYQSLAKGSSYLEESEDLPEFQHVLGSLTDGFEKKLKELSPGALIEDEVRELIITPTDQATSWSNVQTLHKLINLMHQRGESRFDAAARKVEGNMEFSVNGIGFSVANLDDRPLFKKGKPVSLPLSIIIKATRNAQQPPAQKPRLIVTGNYLQGSIQLGAHSANFSALVSPLAEGGRVRLTYTEVADEAGNKMRLRFLAKLMEQFGMRVKLTDDFHLSAVFDKDNGEINKIDIPELLDLMVRALYYSSGLDYAFEAILRKRASDNWWISERAFESVLKEVDVMARVFYAEGAIPFFTPYKSEWGGEFSRNIQSYVDDEPRRIRLRETLNSILHGCGLSQIPEDRPLGQKVIDDFFVEPLRAAVARGEVVIEEGRARRMEKYNPVGKLARSVAKAPDQAIQLANRLGLYDARSLGLRPIGAVGQLSAGMAQWSIGEGRWIVLFGLYHPETGRILYATAQQVIENAEPQTIRANEAEAILTEAGVIVLDHQDFNRSFMPLAEKLLRSPPRLENMPGFVCYGQGASSGPGWPVAGVASFDPKYRSPPGKKLPFFVVPRLEAHQIELMEAAGAFLVPNGLITSHAFVTLREGKVPGVVVSDAQWISGDSKPTLVVPIWRPRAAVMSEEELWISEGVEEEGRVIEPGTVLLIDGERGAVSILSGDGMGETLGLWEGLSSGHETPASVVASVADSSHFDRLEFVLFQAIWDRSVDEKTRQEIVGLLETVVAVMPEPYQRRFDSLKQTHLDASVERATNYQVAARENRGWYKTVLEIQDTIEKIREQSLSVKTLARILSLQNPLIINLLLDEQEASFQSERLRAQAQRELDAWAAKTLTPADLPQIRKILKRAHLNDVNPNDVSYQHLAEMGRKFFEEKLKRIRETKRVVFATEEVDIDWREDGSKFAHLGESKKIVENNDALVPKGMGLTPFGFEKYLVENGIKRDFDLLVEQLDSLLKDNSIGEPQRQVGIEQISESIQNLIKDHSIPKNGPLAEEIFKMIKILGLEKVLLMVRSNGAQEDGEKMAFAGGARSFSEVELSHLLEKIQETWMSFWTLSAIAYRAHKGVKQADEKMGVIVQEYIKADVSGTLFTRNPSTGANDIFVSAGRGSGKDVEASEVPSDEYAVRKSDGEEIGFPTVRNTPRALSQEQIKHLVRVANALESHFGHSLIIEYLFNEGKLWILQDRYDTAIRNGNGQSTDGSKKGHVSPVGGEMSPGISASPLGLLPLIGQPVYNFLIIFRLNRRLAAGIAGFSEQGVLVSLAGGLAWLLNSVFGIGFVWGLVLSTAIIWKMLPKSHGSRVFVYEKFSALNGWDLKLVDVTDDHLRSLRRASNLFFGSFLVVTLVPVVLPLLGLAVPGSLEQWFFAGATISSLFHGLRNSIKPTTGKVAAMGSAPQWIPPINGESIYRVPEKREWSRINKALLDQTDEILNSLKISARSTVCSIGPGGRIDNTTGPYGLTLERHALTAGSQVHVFERFDNARGRWTKFVDDNAIFGDSLHVHRDVRDAPNSMSARADAIFAFSVFASPQADQNDREATLLKALDLLKPGGHLVVGWYNREPLYKSKTIEMLNSPLVIQRGNLKLDQEGNTHPDSILSHGWAIYKWEPFPSPIEKSPYRENAARVLILASLLWIAVAATGFGHSGDLMLLFGALLPLREIPPSANLPYDPNHPISWGHGSDHPGSAVVIGDADASFGAVKKILTSEGLVDEKDRWVGGRRVVVQVGDVVGRGQEPKELYEYLINIQAQARKAGGNLVLLLGNHEMALLMGQPIGGDFKENQTSVRDELRELLAQWVKNGNIQCAAVLTNPKGKNYLVTHAGYSIRLKEMLPGLPVWQEWLESESPQTAGTPPHEDVLVVQQFLNQAVVKIAEEIPSKSGADLTKRFREYLNRSNGILLGSEGVLNRVAKFVDDGFLPIPQIIGHSVTSSVRFQDKINNVINTDSGLYHPDSQPGRSPMYLRLTGRGAVRAVEIGRFGERRSYRLTNGYNRPRPLNAWGWAVEIKDWMTLKLFPIYWLRLHVNHASTLEEMLASYHRFYTVLGRGRLPWHRRSRPEQWLESHRLVVNKLWADRASWRFVQLDGGENDLNVIMSNENRFDDLLDRARDVWKTIPGVAKGEVLPAFLASRNYQLYPVQEDAKGQLDLALQHSPVAVSFQETGFLGVHEILIETDIDRIGLLADMTGAIAARGFSVLVGDVRVEEGVVLGRFDVGGLSMDASKRSEQRLSLEKDLSELILGKIGVGDLFKRNGLRYAFSLTPGQGKPPSVVGFHDGNLTVLTPDRDQPGLLHIIARKLADLDCNISLAPHSIHTQGDTVFDFFKVVESNGESLSPQRKITVNNELKALLEKETITEDDFKTEENLFANRVVSELDQTIAFEDFGRVDRALLGGEAGPLNVGRLTASVDEIRALVQNNRLQARLAREFLEREMGEWELRGEDGQMSKQSVFHAGRSLGQAIRHRETGWENPLVQARQMTLAALVSLGESLTGEPQEKWAEWAASFAQGFNEDLYGVDEVISSSLSSRRQIVLEVSETMLAGNPTEEEKSRLNEWAVLMARLNDMKDREVHWILPSESANLKELERIYPNLAPLFSHRSRVFNKGLFRTEQGKYSVKNFLLASQGKSRVADLESADLYLSSRDEWVLESDLPNDVVRILISLVGGLIYDATESVGTDLKRLYHLGTNA